MKMLWTLTGMYLPIRLILYPCGMEWVWGICIGVSSVDTHSLVKELVPPRCADEQRYRAHVFLF